MTDRQQWARKRNWLIMRLKGASTIFSHENIALLRTTMPKSEWDDISRVSIGIDKLLEKLSDSKYPTNKRKGK